MHLSVNQMPSGKYGFNVVFSDHDIFSSSDRYFPFLGEYGEYSSPDEAFRQSCRFLWKNASWLSSIAADEGRVSPESVKSKVISKFELGVEIFLDMLNKIRHTKEEGDLSLRVNNLKGLVDQYAKSIYDTAKQFENDERVENIPEEQNIQEIGYEQLKSPYAKDLLSLKKKLNRFYRKLRKHFGDYIEAVSSGVFTTVLAGGDISWANEILEEYGESAAGRLSLNSAGLRKIQKTADGYDVLIGSEDGDVMLVFSNDLILELIQPQEGLIDRYPPLSQVYYNDIWLPVFEEVGHFRIGDSIVLPISPESSDREIGYQADGRYLKDSFIAFDLETNEETKMDVYLAGESNLHKTCSFVFASNKGTEDKRRQTMLANKEVLAKSKMVKCTETGSKYDGIAGEIIHDKIVERNGYFEIPVIFKFDTGVKETVVLTSDMVERYI